MNIILILKNFTTGAPLVRIHDNIATVDMAGLLTLGLVNQIQ
jgi:hypothetical protein